MLTIPDKLTQALIIQGFDPMDAPYSITSDWEQFPIIKAIRRAEQKTGLVWPFKVLASDPKRKCESK